MSPRLNDLHDAAARITAAKDVDGNWVRPPVFSLLVGSTVITTGSSGRALAQFAFANGAQSCNHDYDLGLEPASVTKVRR